MNRIADLEYCEKQKFFNGMNTELNKMRPLENATKKRWIELNYLYYNSKMLMFREKLKLVRSNDGINVSSSI